jgi:hypothetical protein
MRKGALRRSGPQYSQLAQDDAHYVAPRSAPPGSLRSYLDNLDNPDNELFQRGFQTTINVAMLWGAAFAFVFPELRLPIGAVFIVVAAIAAFLTHM